MKISTILLFLFCFVITFQNYQFLFAQVIEQKILPGDGAAEDYFGNSVSISGIYAIVGAHLNDDNGTQSGSAYIFRKDDANWIEEQKLLPSDGAEVDLFGYSVSISGDYAIVSADHDSVSGEDSGSAYIFRRNGTNWIEEQKLVASDGAAGDRFGTSVAISGNYAIVGAYLSSGNDQGAAYIFKRDSTNWIEENKLTASDAEATDWFGFTVSISGYYVIVGAYLNDDNGGNSGSAYVFRKDGTNWIEEQKLLPSDGVEGDMFGVSVSISGEYAIVGIGSGSPRSAYIFRRNGTNWIEEQKLVASDIATGGSLGWSVSISGDYAIAGDWANDDNGTNSGSAYIFTRNGTNWIEVKKLLPIDGAADDRFGTSVAISGDYGLIGANQDDDNGFNSGSAYVYNDFIVDVENEKLGHPFSFSLHQNYPNPFNPTSAISFSIPELTFVTLKVYDVLGNEIATLVNEEKPVGRYEVIFNATRLPSGIYFYQLQAGSFVETKKMVLLK